MGDERRRGDRFGGPPGGPAKEDGLNAHATGLARLLGGVEGERSTVARARSFRALEARMGLTRDRARRRRLVMASVGCLALAGAVGFVGRGRFEQRTPAALTYTVNGGAPERGGYVLPAPAAGAPLLTFSDGTRVQMGAEARGRIVEIGQHGARIALEDGRARVAVAHRPGARWVFEAGPFLINVQGTSFDFGWNGREARFDIQMESGAVSVTGPVSGGEIVLRAPQRLAIDLRDRPAPAPVAEGDAKEEAELPDGPGLAPPAAAAPPPPARHRVSVRALPWSATGWTARLAEGRAEQIVAEARRLGIAKVLERGSSEELSALASAARYQREDGLARRALLAQRRRFPRSTRAAEASFLLGRLDDESADAARALAWYDRYLDEAPKGAYVSETLGRKMVVLQRTGRQEEAVSIAAEYLRRFPGGTYAHAAKALVRTTP